MFEVTVSTNIFLIHLKQNGFFFVTLNYFRKVFIILMKIRVKTPTLIGLA